MALRTQSQLAQAVRAQSVEALERLVQILFLVLLLLPVVDLELMAMPVAAARAAAQPHPQLEMERLTKVTTVLKVTTTAQVMLLAAEAAVLAQLVEVLRQAMQATAGRGSRQPSLALA